MVLRLFVTKAGNTDQMMGDIDVIGNAPDATYSSLNNVSLGTVPIHWKRETSTSANVLLSADNIDKGVTPTAAFFVLAEGGHGSGCDDSMCSLGHVDERTKPRRQLSF